MMLGWLFILGGGPAQIKDPNWFGNVPANVLAHCSTRPKTHTWIAYKFLFKSFRFTVVRIILVDWNGSFKTTLSDNIARRFELIYVFGAPRHQRWRSKTKCPDKWTSWIANSIWHNHNKTNRPKPYFIGLTVNGMILPQKYLHCVNELNLCFLCIL